jgi:hypothetical protein
MCGNELIPGAALAPTTTCNEACEGNDNEFCGGFWLISIYKLSVASTTSSSADGLPGPSKIVLGVTVPAAVLALAGFLW